MDLTDKQERSKKRKHSPFISTLSRSSNSSTSMSETSSLKGKPENSGDDLASRRNPRKAPCSSAQGHHKRSRKQDGCHRSSSQEEDRVHQSLPSISSSLLKKIKSSEFIEFNLLLSRPIASPITSNSQVAYSIQLSGNKGISVKARDPTKPAVVDLVTFLEAWNIYFEASIAFHPHLVSFWGIKK